MLLEAGDASTFFAFIVKGVLEVWVQRVDLREQLVRELRAGDYFNGRNPITIDGQPVVRNGYRAEFLAITPRGLEIVPPGTSVASRTGTPNAVAMS